MSCDNVNEVVCTVNGTCSAEDFESSDAQVTGFQILHRTLSAKKMMRIQDLEKEVLLISRQWVDLNLSIRRLQMHVEV